MEENRNSIKHSFKLTKKGLEILYFVWESINMNQQIVIDVSCMTHPENCPKNASPGLIKALEYGKYYVSSVADARNIIREIKGPKVIQFQPKTVGKEDVSVIRALKDSAYNDEVYIFYNKDDVLETRLQRSERIANEFYISQGIVEH